MDGRQKKKRAEEATIQFWFEMKHVRSLAILPRESRRPSGLRKTR